MRGFATFSIFLALCSPPSSWADSPRPAIDPAIYQEATSPPFSVKIDAKCQFELEKHDLPIPDKSALEPSLLPKTIRGISDVTFYDDKDSDAGANNGVVAYMSDSVESDRILFEAAYRFYAKLKIADDHRKKHEYQMTPIQEVAEFDVMKMALQEAHGDPYLATKVLAVFGHDNEANDFLHGRCRSDLLTALKPADNSTLYLNGAIQELRYSAQDVAFGAKIARACEKMPFSPDSYKSQIKIACNDNFGDYQGDYYHVIMAAFLGCRRTIIDHATSPILSSLGPMTAVTDRLYLRGVREYKTDRFDERVFLLEKLGGENAILPKILKIGLDRIRNRISPALPTRSQIVQKVHHPCPTEVYTQAAAILQRWEFEVDFREKQHKMGMEYGRSLCEKQTSLLSHCP
ncbi:hypothetical protein WDW37_04745 [Bdellovibrionota bacterium FG-1]